MTAERFSNVLLVEDNSRDADLFRHLIQRSEVRARVTQVMGLGEAISACRHEQFDVVLLDLNLPDSKGQQTAAEFCSIFRNLPVLVLSGLSEESMGASSIALGAQDYLVKDDLTSAQLVRSIRYSMRRQAARTELVRRNNELFEELDRQIQQSRIKFGLISAATHQLKGPLGLIAVCLEELQVANVEPDLQRRRKRLGQMEQALAVVLEFLDAIQITSTAVGNQAGCTPIALPIEAFCEDIITELDLIGGDSSSVNFQLEEPWGEILFDPILLRYILSNLLSNAAKYSTSEDVIDLVVSQVGGDIRLVVRDRGIGIPPEEQNKIFNPFYRATNARLAKPGRGLGLAIVQTCVELHRGRLEIESALGCGTMPVQVKITAEREVWQWRREACGDRA